MNNELVDDVFEDGCLFNPQHYHQNTNTDLNINPGSFFDDQTPSPITTLHPGIKQRHSVDDADDDDGWKSYKIEENLKFDDSVTHKVEIHSHI